MEASPVLGRDDGQFGATCDEIEDAVGLGALGEEHAGWFQLDEFATWAFSMQEVSIGMLGSTFCLH